MPAMPPASLTTLPLEILTTLPQFLHSAQDFVALARTCRTLYLSLLSVLPRALVDLARHSFGSEQTAIMFTMQRFRPGRIWRRRLAQADAAAALLPPKNAALVDLIFDTVTPELTARDMLRFLDKAPRCCFCLTQLKQAPPTVRMAAEAAAGYDYPGW